MNLPLAQLEYLWSGGDVLQGGSAPGCWKRELSRHANRLALMSRLSDWLTTFADQDACLLDQPLFGNSLQELTSSNKDPQSVSARTERPKSATHFSAPEARRTPQKTLRRFESSIFEEKSTRGPSRVRLSPGQHGDAAGRGETYVSHLGRRVDRLSLERLAGTSVESDNRTANPLNHVIPRRNGSLASFLQTLSAKEWTNLVALRAAKTWLRNWPPAAARTSARSKFLNQFGKQIPVDSPLLGDQWTTRLSGPEISRDVLDQLVTKRETVGFVPVEMKQLRSASPGADNSAARRRAPSANAARHPKHLSANDPAAVINTESFDRIFSEKARRVGFPELDRGLLAGQDQFAVRNQHELPTSSNIAPPALSSSLPPLVPAASAGSTAPPIAANTASEWSWHDEAAAQEKDLNVLAAQIKRILDDEARRHGIDV
jgi:hypothetical protein